VQSGLAKAYAMLTTQDIEAALDRRNQAHKPLAPAIISSPGNMRILVRQAAELSMQRDDDRPISQSALALTLTSRNRHI